MKEFAIGNYIIGHGKPLLFFCGPCVIEGADACLRAAEHLASLFRQRGLQLVFKSSYDKANRSSLQAYRGPGLDEGLRILQRVREEVGLPVLTDVHSVAEARAAAAVCEVIQVPAFLCRQTDLLVAAAQTGAVVNVKKGQFMAPWDMGNVVEKIRAHGNERIILTERGSTFGYNNLVCDMRALDIMAKLGVPVCFDATHAVQLPGGEGHCSGGERHYVELLARAAVAAGVQALFLEAHPHPQKALCDAATQIAFEALPRLLDSVVAYHELTLRHTAEAPL